MKMINRWYEVVILSYDARCVPDYSIYFHQHVSVSLRTSSFPYFLRPYLTEYRPRSYDGCIVHGLMVAGLFSTAFGRAISGALYVSQTLK